jgi:hypothetical protein
MWQKKCIQGFGGQPWRGILEDLRVDRRYCQTHHKELGWNGLGWINLVMAGSCQRVNGTLGSIQMGNFLTSWETIRYSRRRSLLHGASRGTSWPASVKFNWVSTHETRVFDVRIFAWRLRIHMMSPSVTLRKRAARSHIPEGKLSQPKASELQATSTNYSLKFFWQDSQYSSRGFLAVSSTLISPLVSCLPQNNRVQLRPENALLVCVPSKWAVMTLPRINETNIPRLVPSTARTSSSKALGTLGLFRQLGYQLPSVPRNAPPTYSNGQYPALRHTPWGLHPQTSTMWKPPFSQCSLKRISGAERTEWWPLNNFT